MYDSPLPTDGTRILVDRLWPRGLAKDKARIDLWPRDLAPSHALRKQFHGRPEEWDAFREAYDAELSGPEQQVAAESLLERLAIGTVTLLYAARDEERNNAIALKLWLDRQRKERG